MARILVVDDDAMVLASIKRILGSAGHDVVEAANGKEAIRMLDAGEFAVVITDINMPEMDGIELVDTLRGSRPGVPVVAISGGGLMPKELLLRDASMLGAVESIQKPFAPHELMDAVMRALGASGDVVD